MPASFSENTEGLENSLGYVFKDKSLLVEALTHKSFQNENPLEAKSYNERLEFLGDSVLGLAISEILFNKTPLLSESEMSKMKSCLVNENVLHKVSEKIFVGKFIRLGKGEEISGGRLKKSILSDAVEAILGAVFLDGGYKAAYKVVEELLRENVHSVVYLKEDYDFKSELQERCQAEFELLPDYRIVKQEGEEHQKVFTAEVYIKGILGGKGKGKSKKEAQQTAAKEAIKKLDSVAVDLLTR
ncbi:MAG: ribonuclease III [Nitrospirae bacterium]|nr:ribonuclease III [Nitrospirota bacterium]